VLHDDFTQYPQTLLDQLKGAEGCVWALGVSANDVSKEQYIKITYDYSLAAAKAFATLSDPFKFVFVSGEGADPTERAWSFFGKIKGRTEKDLHTLSSSTPSLRTFAVRPGFIDPEGEILRARTKFEMAADCTVGPALRWFGKGLVIGTRPLARLLTDLAIGNGYPIPEGQGVESDGRTLRNTAVRRLAGL